MGNKSTSSRNRSLIDLSATDRILLGQLREERGERGERATIILRLGDGVSRGELAEDLGCSAKRISKWKARYLKAGIEGLKDEPCGRPPKSDEVEVLQGAGKPMIPDIPKHKDLPVPPTMRMVAQTAGVGTMTVSRVLRNQANVRPELKRRVWDAVRLHGYRPDPEVSKLMAHLRRQKVVRHQGTICSLQAQSWSAFRDGHSDTYFRTLIAGAKARAETLGFVWESYPLEWFLAKPVHTLNVLYSRGIEGIFLPPTPIPTETLNGDQIDERAWDPFSVITATYAIANPVFRRVVPDHFQNMALICKQLAVLGYQRIGLAIPRNLDERVYHHYTGGYLAYHLGENRKMPRPLLYGNINKEDGEIRKWYEEERPDVIIISASSIVENVIQCIEFTLQKAVGIAVLTIPNETTAGVDEMPEQIGMIAAETLGAMILQQEKGIPSQPTTTQVMGTWRNGPSVRAVAIM